MQIENQTFEHNGFCSCLMFTNQSLINTYIKTYKTNCDISISNVDVESFIISFVTDLISEREGHDDETQAEVSKGQ